MARTTDYINRNCYLCSEHFEDSQFMNASTKDRLNWKAVPTKFNVPNPPQKVAPKRKLPTKRGGPVSKRSRKKSTEEQPDKGNDK